MRMSHNFRSNTQINKIGVLLVLFVCYSCLHAHCLAVKNVTKFAFFLKKNSISQKIFLKKILKNKYFHLFSEIKFKKC